MKKATIARFVIGLAAISAVGCSAETGAPEAEGVGATSEAVTVTASTFDAATAREFGASCVVNNGATNYQLVASGKTSAGTYLRDMQLFNPAAASGSQWKSLNITGSMPASNLFGSSGDERWHAKLVRISSNSCLLAGGFNGSGEVATTFLLTVNFTNSPPTVAITAAGSLNSPRSKFQLFPCGSTAIAIGGAKSSGTTPLVPGTDKTIEVWNSGSNTWSQATHLVGGVATATDLTSGRYQFAAIKDSTASTNRYVIADGKTASGFLDTIELIDATSSCDKTATTDGNVSTGGSRFLADQVDGGALLDLGSSVFLHVGGVNASHTLLTKADTITPNWSVPGSSTVSASASGAYTGAHLPNLVYTGTEYFIIAGDNGAASPTALTLVQQYTPGTGWGTTANLAASRVGAVAEYLQTVGGNRDAYVSSGYNPGGPTDRTTTEEMHQ